MISRPRHLAIALIVAILAGVSPCRSAIRPTADPYPATVDLLTPLPLDGSGTPWRAEGRTTAVPLHPASGHSSDNLAARAPALGAAEWSDGNAAPLLIFSGIGAFLLLLMILLATRRKPQRGHTP